MSNTVKTRGIRYFCWLAGDTRFQQTLPVSLKKGTNAKKCLKGHKAQLFCCFYVLFWWKQGFFFNQRSHGQKSVSFNSKWCCFTAINFHLGVKKNAVKMLWKVSVYSQTYAFLTVRNCTTKFSPSKKYLKIIYNLVLCPFNPIFSLVLNPRSSILQCPLVDTTWAVTILG